MQQFVYILNTCCKIKRFKSTFYQVFSSLKTSRKSAVSTKKEASAAWRKPLLKDICMILYLSITIESI